MELENKILTSAILNNTLCRVCLTSNENNQCILRMSQDNAKCGKVSNFLDKLQLCGGIEILEDDGLPTSICTRCTLKVNAAYKLREQCQKADSRLRELCGMPLKRYSPGTTLLIKDQCCQTELLPIHFVNTEESTSPDSEINKEKDILICNNEVLLQCTDFNQEVQCNDNDPGSMDMDNIKSKEIEQGKGIVKKEAQRTRKLSMFKMVTSMESLKSYKERQRQYIKKSINNKHDVSEKNVTNNKVERFSKTDIEGPHKCTKCNRCYSSKKSFDRHTLTHSDKTFHIALGHEDKLHKAKEKPMPVQCKICDKNFRKTDTMVRHLNVHKRANPKEVFTILKEIRDKRKLENNLEQIEEEKVVHSDEINVKELDNYTDTKLESSNSVSESQENSTYNHCSSNSETNSDNELESFNNSTLYRCNQCTKYYSSERSLHRHLLVHDEKKYVCNVCNMKFFRQDRLKSHRDKHGHNEDKVSPEPQKPPDDKSAIKLINSWIREELDSDNEGKGFPCTICGKSYDTKKSLLKHEVNMHSSQENKCTVCGDTCKCLENGKNQEKSSEKSKPFICTVCNKSFEKENKLQKHMRIHERAKEQQDSNFKRFLCHICSKTFRQNTGLMFHMRTHTGYKPHVCKYCGRGFTSNSNCINHERTHTGDRPFVCHFCSAAFAKSCTLKAHITTHTGEANYHCKTCGKSFRRLKYLKEHRFTHTGEKPYACKICGTAYSHSGSLFVHEKKCKAQYSSYQAASNQSTQSYGQSQTTISTSAPVITPIVTPSHLNNINSTPGSHVNKNYMESIQRMNAHAAAANANSGLNVHQNQGVNDVTAPVRGFTIIGQIFHS